MELDRHQFIESFSKLSSSEKVATLKNATERLTADEKKGILHDNIQKLPPKERQALMHSLAVLDKPSSSTRNVLWLIVIWGFVIVLVGSFFTLAVSVFVAPPENATSGQLILTIFTSVVGFLAGLFAPSPVTKNED